MNVRRVIPPDAIPSIDDPTFEDEYVGEPDEEVLALDVDGEARAYPVCILNYHEIVNDRIGEVPVAVTWCPLCGSAVVYDRRVGGRVLEFGVSGKLADDDLVMYDRETESEWKQSLGVCIAGELEGTELAVVPAGLLTWADFRERHPDGKVLARPGGESEAASETDDPAPIDYDRAPYERYVEAAGFGLGAHRGTGGRDWPREDLAPKAVVLGLELGGEAVGFPLPAVAGAGGVVTATVGGENVVVFAGEGGIHAYADPGFGFVPEAGGVRGDEARWNPATGASDDGRELARLPARRLFAFAWRDDHGDDAFWSAAAGE